MAMKRVHARVYGRVQGVCYRWSARNEAGQLGIACQVRNCADGTVEVECAGEAKQVDKLLLWLHKGPPAARVERVDVETQYEESAAGLDFQVRATI